MTTTCIKEITDFTNGADVLLNHSGSFEANKEILLAEKGSEIVRISKIFAQDTIIALLFQSDDFVFTLCQKLSTQGKSCDTINVDQGKK